MGFALETGYSLPGGDLPLTHARIVHKGNRLRPRTVTASDESATFPGAATQNGLTDDKWKPFENQVVSPTDFSDNISWEPTRFVVATDGQTLDEGTDEETTAFLRQNLEITAGEWLFSFLLERQTINRIRIQVFDGTTTFQANFRLDQPEVGAVSGGDATGNIVDLGNDIFECTVRMTCAAGSGNLRFYGVSDLISVFYTGTNRTIRLLRAAAHPSTATLRMILPLAAEGDCFAVAGHNLADSGGRIAFEHDSNEDDTYTEIETVTPTDNSPIMFLFEPITSIRWGITVSRAVLPEIAVVRIASALQMESRIHQGFRPFQTNRQTTIRGNVSESGEFIGRSRIRHALSGSFTWSTLTPAWVAANLDGPQGLIQSAEIEPFFIAWRPATYSDCYYCWTTGQVAGPTFSQRPNLSTFSLNANARGWE